MTDYKRIKQEVGESNISKETQEELLILLDGLEGEARGREYIMSKGFKVLQADAIGLKDDKYSLFESKHQFRFDKYNPPYPDGPFDGHGLPKWQIDARLKFQEKMGIRCVFFVTDKLTKEIFYHYLDLLDKK